MRHTMAAIVLVLGAGGCVSAGASDPLSASSVYSIPKGTSLSDVSAQLGAWSAKSNFGNGETLYQWTKTRNRNYDWTVTHIAIVFDRSGLKSIEQYSRN